MLCSSNAKLAAPTQQFVDPNATMVVFLFERWSVGAPRTALLSCTLCHRAFLALAHEQTHTIPPGIPTGCRLHLARRATGSGCGASLAVGVHFFGTSFVYYNGLLSKRWLLVGAPHTTLLRTVFARVFVIYQLFSFVHAVYRDVIAHYWRHERCTCIL